MRDLNKLLSKHDAIQLLEIINASVDCYDTENFKKLLVQLQNLISIDQVFCAFINLENVDLQNLDCLMINVNYSQDYLDRYVSQGYHSNDIIFNKFFSSFELQHWRKVFKEHPEATKSLVNVEARSVGLIDGFTFELGVRLGIWVFIRGSGVWLDFLTFSAARL